MTISSTAVEANFDCLVGPTHHFGGLSLGNLASTSNRARVARPRMAALQGLKKMRFLAEKGFVQGILPPHERPHIKSLKNLGFSGFDHEIIKNAAQKMPEVFKSLCSSSFMWAANSATMSPKMDSADRKAHFTPANLATMFHRSIEHDFTTKVFKKIFADDGFVVHDALLSHDLFSDEGAANHSRLAPSHGHKGLQIFVHGKKSSQSSQKSVVYPARQSLLANEALARLHLLDESHVLHIEQNPKAIDMGAFHNDVVAVANENVLLCHGLAFLNQTEALTAIKDRYQGLFNTPPVIIEIKDEDLPLNQAVSSYLFNSQLLSKTSGSMLLFAPSECLNQPQARLAIEKILACDNPIDEVAFFDVSESMANGGGPACLRLRVVLEAHELSSVRRVLFSEKLFNGLSQVIEKYYVDELTFENFLDRGFINNCRKALEEIASLLELGQIYDFQEDFSY